jgi:hypothetical protein
VCVCVGYTQIVNANLYLASWASFLCVFWIVGDLVGQLYGILLGGIVKSNVTTRRGRWYTLVAASVVVLAASVRVFRAFECDLQVMEAAPTCFDSRYAIATSSIGTFTALLLVTITAGWCCRNSTVALRMEGVGAVLMVIIWSIGLGFITFGEGPGRSIGNLFFATWAAFIISCLIVAECYRDVIGSRHEATSATLDQHGPQTEMSDFDAANVQDL